MKMTVEQPALPRYGQTKRCDDHTYATVKEVTGITDIKQINKAIEACRNNDGKYEVTEVVNMLISDTATKAEKLSDKKDNKMAITYPKETDSIDAVAGPPVNLNKNSKGVIDLTNVSDTNETEDIQKAIAASLVDSGGAYQQETTPGILGGQVSREEQDISRVLEQSLIESKAGTKRKRGDLWFVDPLNPHERKRNENWPIGLKNVGNTCWFSAVIQSLFHLRRFRHLVLTYHPNKEVSQTDQAYVEVRRNLRFMQELRHLFALMVGSKRKYVDPSKAVDILKEAFSSPVVSNTTVSDSQQDVSEFQHKLLDWLEDAFKSASRPASPEQGGEAPLGGNSIPSNPMVDLFYGRFKAEGVNEGKGFSNEETFGQFPLQVNGFRDIHESLEAATAHREIETISSDTTQKSGQELWFTRLPPVLTFELSRFQFNQQYGRPEKIHNKIEFPQIIYMDRYMDCNKDETRHRRERAKKLKEELELLQARLDKFINYGSGVKRFPLQDVLQYALEFAKSRTDAPRKSVLANISQDIDMECPSPNNSMMVDSPIKSPADVVMSTVTSPSPHHTPESSNSSSLTTSPTQPKPIPDAALHPPNTPMTTGTPPDVTMGTESRSSPNTTKAEEVHRSPQPRHVSDNELIVLQNCLHRWRTEVESDVRELQEGIGTLEDSINKMYSDEAMTKNAYHLHAVLVHEGQAASGHYWAYIFDSPSNQWLKFNDITVCEASWEELEKESVGGYHNASAYCLMYIDKSRVHDEPVSGKPGTNTACDLENLPDDLKELVASDNQMFSEEIEKWDRDLARKAAGGGDADAVILAEQKPALPMPSSSSTVSTQTTQASSRSQSYPHTHACLSHQDSLQVLKKVLDTDAYDRKGASSVLDMVIETEHKRLKGVIENIDKIFPIQDPRLQHIVLYVMLCRASNEIIYVMLLDQFAEPVWDKNDKILKIRNFAVDHRKRMLSETAKLDIEYRLWHETFATYRRTAALFVKGVTIYFDEKYVQALSYILHAHRLSEELKRSRHKNAGLPDSRISAFFLRQTLLHINDTITQQFEDKSDVKTLIDSATMHVLPCLQTLVNNGSSDDIKAVEEIREKWCSFLGQEMESQKIELLQDFLSKLFDPPPELKIPDMPSLKVESYQSLHSNFQQVMKIAVESGYIERALENS